MASFQAKEWLKSAYSDLRNIHYIVKDEFLTHMVAFHAQQAIEKSLKAILENEENRIPKVHKLQNLINRVNIDIDFDEHVIEVLDELYIESRYPGDLGLLPEGKPSLDNAESFYDTAQYIFEEVCNLLEVSMDDLL
jgi:HEPN domain-containing protein